MPSRPICIHLIRISLADSQTRSYGPEPAGRLAKDWLTGIFHRSWMLKSSIGSRIWALQKRREFISSKAMWYVNKLFEQAQVESLSARSFLVRSSGGVVRIEKHGCAAELRRAPSGRYQMTIIPSIMVMGQFTRLWDAGYQKFLLTHEGKKFPIRVSQLADLRRFNEELRTALGVPTYYNEALGSTCHYSVYDRVKGRRGDVPDESVGAHEEAEH